MLSLQSSLWEVEQEQEIDTNKQVSLGQYPTPAWVAEAIMERYFPDLGSNDLVIEPSCGPGRFLQAIPAHVPAIGVEIDPVFAAEAAEKTGRRIITGDFCSIDIDVQPTAIIGNPPFNLDTIDGFLNRSHALLPDGGKLGFLLPTYCFQTAARVAGYAEKWSIQQDMLPRNIYPGLKLPLVFAVFTKDRRRKLVGFFLYEEATEVQGLAAPYKKALTEACGSVWRKVVEIALGRLGGEANLKDIYREIERNRPTKTEHWKQQIRKVIRKFSDSFVCTAPGRYALAQ